MARLDAAADLSAPKRPSITGTATDEGRPYRFKDAEKLIADFFDEIERILREVNDGRAD
jgi:hypothetical protein